MNKIKSLFLAFLLLSGLSLSAQISNDKSLIDKVKENRDQYIYAESTEESQEIALSSATANFEEQLASYLSASNLPSDASAIESIISSKATMVAVPRGDRFRAFIFVSKDALGGTNTHDNQQGNHQNNSVEVLPTDNNEPVNMNNTEDLTVKNRVTIIENDSIQGAGDSEIIKPVTPNADNNTVVVDSSITEDTIVLVDDYSVESTLSEETLDYIASLTRINPLRDYMAAMKKEGSITTYEPLKPGVDPTEYYVVLFSRNGDIVAILSPGENRFNLATKQSDSISNYTKCSIEIFK